MDLKNFLIEMLTEATLTKNSVTTDEEIIKKLIRDAVYPGGKPLIANTTDETYIITGSLTPEEIETVRESERLDKKLDAYRKATPEEQVQLYSAERSQNEDLRNKDKPINIDKYEEYLVNKQFEMDSKKQEIANKFLPEVKKLKSALNSNKIVPSIFSNLKVTPQVIARKRAML